MGRGWERTLVIIRTATRQGVRPDRFPEPIETNPPNADVSRFFAPPLPLRLCAFPPPLRYDFSANGFTSALPHILSYWSWYFLASADLPCRSNACASPYSDQPLFLNCSRSSR